MLTAIIALAVQTAPAPILVPQTIPTPSTQPTDSDIAAGRAYGTIDAPSWPKIDELCKQTVDASFALDNDYLQRFFRENDVPPAAQIVLLRHCQTYAKGFAYGQSKPATAGTR